MNAQTITLLKKEEADLFYIGSLNVLEAKKGDKRQSLRRALWPLVIKTQGGGIQKKKGLELHLKHLV